MICVCGCAVTDHAKVYIAQGIVEAYTRPLLPSLPFTLSGRCLKCEAGKCLEFRRPARPSIDAPLLVLFDAVRDGKVSLADLPRRIAIGPMPAAAVKDLRPYRCHWSLGLDDPCELTFSTTSQCKNHDGPRERDAAGIPHPKPKRHYPVPLEWWKQFDRPQSAGRPEVM